MEEEVDGGGAGAVAAILATIRDMDLNQIRHIIGEVTDNDPAVAALMESVFDDEENKTREEIFGLLEQVLLHAFGGSGENAENEKSDTKSKKKSGAKSERVTSKKAVPTVSQRKPLPSKSSYKTPAIVLSSSSSSSSSSTTVQSAPKQSNESKNKRKRPITDSSDSDSTIVYEVGTSSKKKRNDTKPPPPKQSKKVIDVYSSDDSDSDDSGAKGLKDKLKPKSPGVKVRNSEKEKKLPESKKESKEKLIKSEKTDKLHRDSEREKKIKEELKGKASVAAVKKERSEGKKDKSQYEDGSKKIKKEEKTNNSSFKPQNEIRSHVNKKDRRPSTSDEADLKPKDKDRKHLHASSKEQEHRSKGKGKELKRPLKESEAKEKLDKPISSSSKDTPKVKETESKSSGGKASQTNQRDAQSSKKKEDSDVLVIGTGGRNDVPPETKINSVFTDEDKASENSAKPAHTTIMEICLDSSHSSEELEKLKQVPCTTVQHPVSSSTDNFPKEEISWSRRNEDGPSTNEFSNALKLAETSPGDNISSTQESQFIKSVENSVAVKIAEEAESQGPKDSDDNEAVAKADKEHADNAATRGATDVPMDIEIPGPSHAGDKSGEKKKKSSGAYEDPEFAKYKSKFKLKRFKMVITDIKKQERYHWKEGDPVYRLWKKEQRKKKTLAVVQGHAQRHKFEKYDKKTKKDSNSKREIVREKPVNKQLTDKEKLLEALHQKVPKGKDKRMDLGIVAKPGQSKPLFDGRVPEDFVANYDPFGTLLKPAIEIEKPKFDTNRLVTSTDKTKERKSTWGMTAAEKEALEKESRKLKLQALPKIPKIQKPQSPVVNHRGKRNEPAPAPIDDADFNYYGDDDFIQDDGEQEEQNDDGSVADSEGNAPNVPVTEVRFDSVAKEVMEAFMRYAGTAEQGCTHWDEPLECHEGVVKRTAKWFWLGDRQPYYQRAPSIPENAEEEFYTLLLDDDGDDEISWVGNVSNPDGDDLQDNEITSTARDPDQVDEYCGAGLLFAKYRIKSGEKEDCFASIFDVPTGSNYDKTTFQATCNLCNELITDKRQLSAHLRGSIHRTNLAKTSLKFVDSSQSILNKFREDFIVEMDSRELSKASPKSSVTDRSSLKASRGESKKAASDATSVEKKGEKRKNGAPERTDRPVVASTSKQNKDESSSKHDKEKDRRRRSVSKERERQRERERERERNKGRNRSRSPHRSGRQGRSRSKSPRHRHRRSSRSRSRSPTKRRLSHGDSDSHSRKVEEFLSRNEKSARRGNSPTPSKSKVPFSSKQDEDLIFKEKLKLQANGVWNDDLEGRWKLMEDDQRRLKKLYAVKRKQLEEKPEDHPQYASEWGKFWETRYAELEKKGKNPDTHDYTSEWKIVWGKLSDKLLQGEHDAKLIETRIKYGVDLASLKRLNAQVPPPTPAQNVVPPASASYGSFPSHMPPAPGPVPSPYYGNPNQHLLVGPPVQIPGMVPPPMHPNMGYGPFVGVGFAPMMPSPGFPPVPGAHHNNPRMNTMAPPLNTGVPFMTRTSAPSMTTVHVAEPNVPGTESIDPSVDYSEKPMSISSAGSASSSVKLVESGQPKPTVTVDDIKSTWQNLTGQKITSQSAEAKTGKVDSASVISVSSSDSYNYEGQNVIRTLKLMIELEDHLSFLADTVKEYYTKAETMDKQKMDLSMGLLKEKAFVELLYRCRDKIFASLRANIGPSEVKSKLNRLVYSLGILLDSPKCLKIAPPKSNDAATRSEALAPRNIVQPAKISPEVQILRHAGNPVAEAFAGISYAKKVEISTTIAKSLTAQGQDRWNGEQLLSSLINLVAPIRNDIQRVKNSSGETTVSQSFQSGGSGNPDSRTQPAFGQGGRQERYFNQNESDSYNRTPWRGSSRDFVAPGPSNRGMPPMEGIRARPASPPPDDSRRAREPTGGSSPILLPNPLARRDGGRNYRNHSSASESQVNDDLRGTDGNLNIDADSPYSPGSSFVDLSLAVKTFKDQRHKEATVSQNLESIDDHSKNDASAILPVPSLADLRLLLDGDEECNKAGEGSHQLKGNLDNSLAGSESQSVEVIDFNEAEDDDQMKNLPPGIRMLIMKEKESPGPSIAEILETAEKSGTEPRNRKYSTSSSAHGTETSGKRKRRKSKTKIKGRGSSKEDKRKRELSRHESSRRKDRSRERDKDDTKGRRRSYDDDHRDKRRKIDNRHNRISHEEVRIPRVAPPRNDSYPGESHSPCESSRKYCKHTSDREVEAHIRTVSEEFWDPADDLELIEDFPKPNNSREDVTPGGSQSEKKSRKTANGSYRLHGVVDAEDGEIISSDDGF